jgi:7,8-dihydropterin-6-yl-methyl-4-(beta-D-ribofuranosyl)aminobenzene 5'-phosphate synthase
MAQETTGAPGTIPLPPVDEVQITTIMDNSLDMLMAGNEVARRIALGPNPFERQQPIAQHGFSVRLRVRQGAKSGDVLFDTGVSREGTLHNLDALEVRLNEVQAIVLSHGHADHALGLTGIIERLGTRRMPLVLHPDAYLARKLILPNGDELHIPPPHKADFARDNIQVIEEIGPSLLVDGMVLISGEVSRATDFETGFPIHYAKHGDVWEPDPVIHDDQCAIVNVRDKGLVVVSGCGHAGIVNILLHAKALTGVEQIYAVVGGFHLTGAIFEPRIAPTVAALQTLDPRYLVPGHCTGWRATQEIARAMPDAFVANSVGTTFVFAA